MLELFESKRPNISRFSVIWNHGCAELGGGEGSGVGIILWTDRSNIVDLLPVLNLSTDFNTGLQAWTSTGAEK
jgi:hypothetical protein